MSPPSLGLWQAVVGRDPATSLATRDGLWSTFTAIYACFLGLQVLDLASTVAVLGLGGAEGNPWGPLQVLAAVGPVGLLGLKLGLLVLTLVTWMPAVAFLARRDGGPMPAKLAVVVPLVAVTLFYAGVVYWNIVNVGVLASGR